MSDTVQFRIGAPVSCADGPCGQVTRVVVDPVAQTVTHIAVEPAHRQGLARLVPVGRARLDTAGPAPDGIRLDCTMAEFEALDPAEETLFVPGTRGYDVYGPEQVLSWPYYQLGDTVMFPDDEGKASETVTTDTVPRGEVAVQRGAHVHATDGPIGQVQGLVIDAGTGHVTHVLLQEGHLWGRKQVAIPISVVTELGDGIGLSISKREVEDLPPVSVAGTA
jgi:sporulation protein YlmC with PRC-barrel domain